MKTAQRETRLYLSERMFTLTFCFSYFKSWPEKLLRILEEHPSEASLLCHGAPGSARRSWSSFSTQGRAPSTWVGAGPPSASTKGTRGKAQNQKSVGTSMAVSSRLEQITHAPAITKPRATAKGSRWKEPGPLCRRWLPTPLSRCRGLPPAAGLGVRPLALHNSHSCYPKTAQMKGRLVPHAPACVHSPPRLSSSP